MPVHYYATEKNICLPICRDIDSPVSSFINYKYFIMELLKHFQLDVQRPGWIYFSNVFVNKNGGAYGQLRKEYYRSKVKRRGRSKKTDKAITTLRKILLKH